jgi:nitrogen-specific signal transduction histidine kinase/CheY-like chemotaxis protein
MLRHTNRELRRQAEMLEEVNQQLREATRAKDQFMAVMSHELRTPINAIMGYSDLLDLGVKGDLNDDQRAMLARVRDTSRHLLGLINEVLDLAKIGAGRMDLTIAELRVRDVVERAAQQILPIASAKGLALEVVHTDADADATVLADETRLTQIVINLLSNAVKFTTTGSISIGFARLGERVEILVRDTGPGISAEQQERIFEEFYQVEGGLARASGGTGLGLAIARRFARLMGGDITVSSVRGTGSEFRVHLPAAGVRRDGDGDAAAVRKVVALVHDERAALRIQQDLAGSVEVVGTLDAMRVATLVRQTGGTAVALDARSNGAGAWLALTSLQQDRETADVRTLLFAHEDDTGETALELGRFVTLAKPVEAGAAEAVIRNAAPGLRVGAVLVAESDPETARRLGDALRHAGWNVHLVPDGPRLLAELGEERPDVIVLDLLAPGMTGVEVMARLRADHALRDIALVVLLARDLTADEIDRLDRSVAALSRGRRARVDATAELIRSVAFAEPDTGGTGSTR